MTSEQNESLQLDQQSFLQNYWYFEVAWTEVIDFSESILALEALNNFVLENSELYNNIFS